MFADLGQGLWEHQQREGNTGNRIDPETLYACNPTMKNLVNHNAFNNYFKKMSYLFCRVLLLNITNILYKLRIDSLN